jgi:histidine triad (HIT) family protein
MPEKTVFSKIIDRELPADILFENERIILIKDIRPDAPVHILAIPKQPYPNVDALLADTANGKELLWELTTALRTLAHSLGIGESGYRIVTNNGPDAHQVVPHLHIHLLGGEPLRMHAKPGEPSTPEPAG